MVLLFVSSDHPTLHGCQRGCDPRGGWVKLESPIDFFYERESFSDLSGESPQYFRALLSEPTLKKVAYENALRIFHLKNSAYQ